MAQDGVLGERAAALREGVDVVDALADKRPFAEQVLIEVRHDARVGIQAGVSREQADEPGAPGARQADADARLQDPVTGDYAPAHRVDHRPVEDMSHRPDHFARRIERQLRVGVEGNDIAHLGQHGRVADDLGEPIARAAQQGVELRQLAALALVRHPYAFARIPAARPMKEVENVGPMVLVLFVEAFDALAGRPHQYLVPGQRLVRRIFKVCQ